MAMYERLDAGGARVEAVLFDYGLVLTGPPDPTAWEEMRAILGVPEPEFHAAYWRHRHDYDRGALNGRAYWRVVAGDLHRQMIEPQLGMVIEADTALWTQPNPPMIAWAAALQAAGVRTGILSNLGDAMEEGVLRRCRWMGGFAHHTFSHRLRMAKPDAAIYQAAAEGLGVLAKAVLFVDDRAENIRGAIEAGMQAIQYVDHAKFLREFAERGFGEELPNPQG